MDAEGAPIVKQMGDMVIETDENGEALIKYIAPGKVVLTIELLVLEVICNSESKGYFIKETFSNWMTSWYQCTTL